MHHPQNDQETNCTDRQDLIRTNIERFLGETQSRFGILRKENGRWNVNEVVMISECCDIIHEMIIEHVKNDGVGEEKDRNILFKFGKNINPATYKHKTQATQFSESTETEHIEEHAPTVSFDTMFINKAEITNYSGFEKLQKELIEIVSTAGAEDTNNSDWLCIQQNQVL